VQAVAQALAGAGGAQQGVEVVAQGVEVGGEARVGEEVDLFLGEVDRGFDVGAQVDQALEQGIDALRELALQAARGGAGLGFGSGGDEVGDGFGLREVDAPMAEGALAELAGPGAAGAERHAAGEQQVEHDRAAVGVQFDHVFAGEGLRGVEAQDQALVDGAAVGGAEGGEGGDSGWGFAAGEGVDQVHRLRAR